MLEYIEIKGAREHNLKNVSVRIPKNKLVALTGISGSGKSSFAMDILQKECQRQYMESMGFVTDGLNKPKVDSIVGLSPSIAIGQRVLSNNPRSTVGTYTEILTYLRILYAKLGERCCDLCGKKFLPDYETEEESELDETVVNCPHCGTPHKKLSMATFSFNKPDGACPTCNGIGTIIDVDLSSLIDENLTVEQGAVKLWLDPVICKFYADTLVKCGEYYGFTFNIDKPIKEYNELERLVFLEGVDSTEFKELFPNKKKPKRVNDGYFKGIMTYMREKAAESIKKEIKNSKIESCMVKTTCPSCKGTRLGHEGRTVTLNGISIITLSSYTIEQLYGWICEFEQSLSESAIIVSQTVITDVKKRANGIISIGLGYLSNDRPISSLSGGEAQRLRLANIVDSGLTGVLYMLDEPTTGLHPRDTKMLLNSLNHLRDLGNTVLVIEHDMDFVQRCDYVIDFGPGAGINGGQIVAMGSPVEIKESAASVTGKYLSPRNRKLQKTEKPASRYINVANAYAHNLKNVSVSIPLGQLVSFTGVSGSGKSSLVFNVISEYAAYGKADCQSVNGLEFIKEVITLDQRPIGRQSRSNIATYTDIFTLIRELFAALPEAKKRKLKPSDFSFNVKGGRCEKCQGLGVIPLDMQFLDDVEVLCPVCRGKRFKKKVLEVTYQGKNISDVLNATVAENLVFFEHNNDIRHRLQTLYDVGLDYLKLGQSTTTLSGGECQRIKLSRELVKQAQGHNLYLLDEPTTGLHPSDIDRIMKLLRKLVAQGNSVFVIEHALEVISQSDLVIDLGMEGGSKGGNIVAIGTPSALAAEQKSYTGKYLREYIKE